MMKLPVSNGIFDRMSPLSWCGIALSLVAGCGAPKDENFNGYCRLSCSKTSLASSDFTTENILQPADYACFGSYEEDSIGGGRLAKWVVKSPISRVDGSAVDVERPAIAFMPHFGGAPYAARYNSTDGVITPESELCSDSCGVLTVVVSDLCPAATSPIDYSYTLMVQSGAIMSAALTWTNTKPPKPQ